MNKSVLAIILLLAALPLATPAAAAPVWTGLLGSQAAVGGYDSVSYFTGKPVPGSDQFTTTYNGATFKFATAANLAAFKANPARYAPQYGGHCAWAAANNYRFAGDPKIWKIVNNKLYLNFNQDVQTKWEKEIPTLIKKADQNWQTLGK